ncbi:hypothetical protein WICMUC_000876 [Wickerhamomyces mucosus]|uniref:Alpha-1,2-mannosyltransferase n=1 Tax=Wickerhamomyces mucosus TaxID=1378264 RepID=A0A9P8PW63_9ASCO|nr:hypothetical protein WICMUC_000876 [Wickerhamomyces mucosus]
MVLNIIPKKYQRYVLAFIVILTIIFFTTTETTNLNKFKSQLQSDSKSNHDITYHSTTGSNIITTDSNTGYDWVLDIINKNSPGVKPLIEFKGQYQAKEKFASDDDFIFSKEYLSNIVPLDDLTFKRLKQSHIAYLDDILNDKHTSFGNEFKTPEGEGIVFVGGIKFSWLSLIVIEQLRNTGCKLPIEVFIGTENEYEEEFCEQILPRYNGRCTYLPGEIGDVSTKIDAKINGYQYKNLAFLISNFKKILFLDADNCPLFDPTPLFKSKAFQDNGLVIWPDVWARTTHPKYYEIAGLEIKNKIIRGPLQSKPLNEDFDFNTQVNFHDLEGTLPNPSSESGMILVDKVKHVKTLLLSLYYNIYGPNLYYSLFTQGSAGEGDKETFIAAATVLNTSYYQVIEMFKFIGYHFNEKFSSKALGQFDPIQDYKNYQSGTKIGEDIRLIKSSNYIEPKVFFMHLSYPKLVPFALLNDNEIIKENQQHIRMYRGSTELAGYDFELQIFQILTSLLCENYTGNSPVLENLLGLKLKEYWGQDPNTFCPSLIEHVKFLESNPE